MTGITGRLVAGATILLLTACGGAFGQQSTGTSEQTGIPSASTVSPGVMQWPSATQPDVTSADLLTAESPEACGPSVRMVDGRAGSGVPISEVLWESGHPDSPVFLDMAHLGYEQAFAFFMCGGASPIPYYLMLTGTDGELLGQAFLGDLGNYAKSYVISTHIEGSDVVIEWWGVQTAVGSTPTHHLSRASFADGRLVLEEIEEPGVLGVPLDHVIRVNSDASFLSPSGKLACRMGSGATYCEGVSLEAAPDHSYCRAPVGMVSGVVVDGKAGWHCTSQATIFPTTDQQWWQGRGFPTIDPPNGGPGPAPVLPYGWVVQSNLHACVIQPEGVTCQELYSGNGFFGNDVEVTFTGEVHQREGD